MNLQAERIQRVLDRDPGAVYRVLEGPGDRLSFIDGILELNTSQNGLEVFQGIISLEVENPLDVRRYFRIAPGKFIGFGKCIYLVQEPLALILLLLHFVAQLAISDNRATLVQFGVNPNVSLH